MFRLVGHMSEFLVESGQLIMTLGIRPTFFGEEMAMFLGYKEHTFRFQKFEPSIQLLGTFVNADLYLQTEDVVILSKIKWLLVSLL